MVRCQKYIIRKNMLYFNHRFVWLNLDFYPSPKKVQSCKSANTSVINNKSSNCNVLSF